MKVSGNHVRHGVKEVTSEKKQPFKERNDPPVRSAPSSPALQAQTWSLSPPLSLKLRVYQTTNCTLPLPVTSSRSAMVLGGVLAIASCLPWVAVPKRHSRGGPKAAGIRSLAVPQARSQVAGKATRPPRAPGEGPSASSSFRWLWHSLACGPVTLTSASVFTRLLSLCLCVLSSPHKDTSHCSHGPSHIWGNFNSRVITNHIRKGPFPTKVTC